MRDAGVAERNASRRDSLSAARGPPSHPVFAQIPQPPMPSRPYSPPRVEQYPQGPQGDPFAQPPVYVPPVQDPVPLPAKPLKKKKKRAPLREEECGFCHGNDSWSNETQQAEVMVTCVDCGRSGECPPAGP